MTPPTPEAPIWRGSVALSWRRYIDGPLIYALCAGTLVIGLVSHTHPSLAPAPNMPWHARFSSGWQARELGWFATEQAARDALVDAVVREIGG